MREKVMEGKYSMCVCVCAKLTDAYR